MAIYKEFDSIDIMVYPNEEVTMTIFPPSQKELKTKSYQRFELVMKFKHENNF